MSEPSCSPGGALEIEQLLTDDQRRTVSVKVHQAFRESIAPRPAVDPIDELVAVSNLQPTSRS